MRSISGSIKWGKGWGLRAPQRDEAQRRASRSSCGGNRVARDGAEEIAQQGTGAQHRAARSVAGGNHAAMDRGMASCRTLLLWSVGKKVVRYSRAQQPVRASGRTLSAERPGASMTDSDYAPSRTSDGLDRPGPDFSTDPRSEANASYPFAPTCPRDTHAHSLRSPLPLPAPFLFCSRLVLSLLRSLPLFAAALRDRR
jgi:hypothetical protein